MIDENLLKNLDESNPDKQKVLQTLETLIHQTYSVEQKFNDLNHSYINLENIIRQIIECLPNAIWVLEKDGDIFLQNTQAKKLVFLFALIDLEKTTDEIEYENHFYLIQINVESEKTIISATDITDEKRKERLVSMGQVAAHLAHEIRNPIGSVALLTSTLLKKVDVKQKPLVFEIKKSIWRVERIVKATLLFSKGLKLSPQDFPLTLLKDEMEVAIGYYTFSKEIAFDFDFPEISIHADSDLLSMVFQNFLFNAIDAIEDQDETEEGLIEFSYVEDSQFHVFRVYDSGIPIENKNLLFEPFKTTKTKGNGLGLALSLQIVNAHNGDITLLEGKKGFQIRISKNVYSTVG